MLILVVSGSLNVTVPHYTSICVRQVVCEVLYRVGLAGEDCLHFIRTFLRNVSFYDCGAYLLYLGNGGFCREINCKYYVLYGPVQE
jgi:hypothetical protein